MKNSKINFKIRNSNFLLGLTIGKRERERGRKRCSMYAMDQKSNLCFFFNSMFEDENHLNLDWCGGWKRWLVEE